MFPELGDPAFQGKLAKMKEFAVHAAPSQEVVATKEAFLKRVGEQCDPSKFEKGMHQHLIEHYLSLSTPYRGLLLYHGVGVGKTCASIAVAESLLMGPSGSGGAGGAGGGAKIWVVVPKALKKSYEEQIFDVSRLVNVKEQCTADTYLKLVPGHARLDEDTLATKIRALIKGRYEFFTYEGFAIRVEELEASGRTADVFQNKLLIIDEAHNIRLGDEKQIEEPLKRLLTVGKNNRLLLLSATPMYNDPEEIFWLLSLLALNDKIALPTPTPRLFNESTGLANTASFDLLKQLAQEYISYVKGVNPFIFAVRLSPAVNGTPMLNKCPKYGLNGTITPAYQSEWYKSVTDGIVTTDIGAAQAAALAKGLGKKAMAAVAATGTGAAATGTGAAGGKGNDSMVLLQQANNVVYKSGRLGEKGFKGTFLATDEDKPYQFKYATPELPILTPGPEYLGKYASKINRIIEFIQKSKGIVMIYSQYVWSGVVPMAAALEHIGFQRYKSRPMIAGLTGLAGGRPASPFSYAILSGDRNLMGPSIESLKAAINARDNIDGSKIKVILLSPVAGEGFSFRNIREVHILDPWFHLNRNDQVVGRAIRTCSHTELPLEERNVTVFLHATIDGERETADLRAYRIASMKADHIQVVNDVITKYAMDCPFQSHLNYIPQDVFGFNITLNSSQGAAVPFHFGDAGEPRLCASPPLSGTGKGEFDSSTWTLGAYKHLLPTLSQRLRRFLDGSPDRHAFDQKELLAAMGVEKVDSLLEPALNVLANVKELTEHLGRYIRVAERGVPGAYRVKIEPVKKKGPMSVREEGRGVRESVREGIEGVREGEDAPSLADYLSFVDILPADKDAAAIVIYSKLDSKLWHSMAKLVVRALFAEDPALETNGFRRLMRVLIDQGLIVRTANKRIVGYVDVFVTPTTISVLDGTGFRDATSDETRELHKSFVPTPLPRPPALYGFFAPHTFAKNNSTARLEFKLFLPETGEAAKTGAREKRGVVCTSSKKDVIEKLVGVGAGTGDAATAAKAITKDTLCTSLAVKLLKEGRLFLPPMLKPAAASASAPA